MPLSPDVLYWPLFALLCAFSCCWRDLRTWLCPNTTKRFASSLKYMIIVNRKKPVKKPSNLDVGGSALSGSSSPLRIPCARRVSYPQHVLPLWTGLHFLRTIWTNNLLRVFCLEIFKTAQLWDFGFGISKQCWYLWIFRRLHDFIQFFNLSSCGSSGYFSYIFASLWPHIYIAT